VEHAVKRKRLGGRGVEEGGDERVAARGRVGESH